MLETSFSILFYIRKPKVYVSGAIPVYMRLTVNGIRKEIGTKQECEPTRWNSHAQRAKGSTETIKTLNAYLDALERRVQEARLKLLETNKTITVEMVMNRFLGIEEKPRMLLDSNLVEKNCS